MARTLYSKISAGVFSAFAVVAISIVFTACGGSSGGSSSTVATVPPNQCAQPGVNNGFGYQNIQGVSPYGYQGQVGCGNGGVPTCYPNNGGLACLPQSAYQNVFSQGYNPMIYGYNQGLNNFGYQGFYGAGSSYYGNFSYGLGAGGYLPNYYVQGCRTDMPYSCGYGGMCRPILGGYGIGVCVR